MKIEKTEWLWELREFSPSFTFTHCEGSSGNFAPLKVKQNILMAVGRETMLGYLGLVDIFVNSFSTSYDNSFSTSYDNLSFSQKQWGNVCGQL